MSEEINVRLSNIFEPT